jgi:hypothetical protein
LVDTVSISMVKIEISKELSSACPSLLDLESSIVNIAAEETIEVSWGNSKQEQVAIKRHQNRKFKLYVPDLQASERTIASLEMPLTLDDHLVGDARIALLNKKLYNWREFSRNMGVTTTKHLVLKIAADEIRDGKRPKLAYVAKDMFLDGVTPSNADTLLRLRHLRGY